jgi:hypothetical protein
VNTSFISSCLAFLESCELRSQITFKNLSNYSFVGEDNTIFVKFYEETSKSEPGITFYKYCARYDVDYSIAKRWLKRHKAGFRNHSAAGRPESIDSNTGKAIQQEIIDLTNKKEPPDEARVKTIIQTKADELSEMCNITPKIMAKNTMRAAIEKLDIQKRVPQVTSNARMKATTDVRMTYAMWIMLKACSNGICPELLWNFDATQLNTKYQGSGRSVYVIKGTVKNPFSVVEDSSLGLGVKWLHIGSAAGDHGPIVLLVAWMELGEDDFIWKTIPALSVHGSSETPGYICFCKSRAGNRAFFPMDANHHHDTYSQ